MENTKVYKQFTDWSHIKMASQMCALFACATKAILS